VGLVTVLLLTMALAASASAASLTDAKEQGWIGEKPDGYIGLVRNDAPLDIQALVREVNSKRRTEYERIAQRQGAPLSEVEKVGGNTAIEKTRPGHYIMDSSGRWRRK
jgi:uncharacterized protein YdbL (DUF1318 family)